MNHQFPMTSQKVFPILFAVTWYVTLKLWIPFDASWLPFQHFFFILNFNKSHEFKWESEAKVKMEFFQFPYETSERMREGELYVVLWFRFIYFWIYNAMQLEWKKSNFIRFKNVSRIIGDWEWKSHDDVFCALFKRAWIVNF